MASSEQSVYGLVGNIPPNYHSCDLRNFFSQFLEEGGFECFHFRHRPEFKMLKQSEVSDSVDSGSNCLSEPVPSAFTKDDTERTDKKQSKTFCCFIKLKQKSLEKLTKMYNRKHWLDKNGDSIAPLCMVSKIRVTDESAPTGNYKTRGELKNIPSGRVTFTHFDLLNLKELHPPDIMPKGNVGTPTKVFLELIQRCKLPPNIIKRLGLSFPKTRTNKKYGCVPFDYGCDVYVPPEYSEEEDVVVSAGGKEIESEGQMSVKRIKTEEAKESRDQEESDQGQEQSGSDDDGGEEWERHESLNDDPANVERNKERIYEEEMEVTWEKGGPGIVWYTDAQFWKEKEGDFDEQTTDDLDIDTSVYYDPNSGDKDARDYMEMRLHQRRRDGTEDTDRFTVGIGKFEKYSRGIGRKVMETQGWEEGQGLGGSRKGISEALEGEGQTPRDRRGFGYLGEKVQRYGQGKKRPRKEGAFFIGTVYDDTGDLQERDTLLRRKHPHAMTYMKHTKFEKSSDTPGNKTVDRT